MTSRSLGSLQIRIDEIQYVQIDEERIEIFVSVLRICTRAWAKEPTLILCVREGTDYRRQDSWSRVCLATRAQ